MYGACTARAAALTLRVSLIYALLDGANEIRKQHLIAALEVWRYCDDSAKYIFGDALGDPTADEILRAVPAAPADDGRRAGRCATEADASASGAGTVD